jgi:hypothetical protein
LQYDSIESLFLVSIVRGMLKKISRLFLGLVVCAGSACVTPTHASSAQQQSVLITRIQASGEFGPKDEYVVLYNNTGVEVDITNWCLANKATVLFACFTTSASQERIYLPSYANAVVASSLHAGANGYPVDAYSAVYEVTNQSSGSIVNSSDSLSIVDSQGEIIEQKLWTIAIPTGKILSRFRIASEADAYVNINESSDWSVEDRALPPMSATTKRIVPTEDIPVPPITPDPIPNLPGPQQEPPEGSQAAVTALITEVMANPAGSDIGNEYIELYNPNPSTAVSLDGFMLRIGAEPAQSYAFPAGATIPALGYAVFSNSDIPYTLVNTTGRVQLVGPNGYVGPAVDYVSPKDDYSWSLINDAWVYTKQATPGKANSLSDDNQAEAEASSSSPKPCASNQYRNPDTGRCRLVATTTSTPTPCKEGQERNPETNRCRNVVTAKEATPCEEGQERNPETNRCRAIVKMSSAGHGVLGVTSKANAAMSWYYWAGIGAVVLLAGAYAVWEWRQEIVSIFGRVRLKFTKRRN